jgi:hypothetical protein
MAGVPFSSTEKALIRQYLGFSELFHDIDPRLESQMAELGDRSPEAADNVRAQLARLANIDARLDGALDNLDLQKAEEVTFLGPDQLEALRDQGRNLIQRIAIVFQVAPQRDYYGVEAASGGILPEG